MDEPPRRPLKDVVTEVAVRWEAEAIAEAERSGCPCQYLKVGDACVRLLNACSLVPRQRR